MNTNPHAISESLARAYHAAATGAHYDASGRNERAEGVIDAACAVLGTGNRDEVESILDGLALDLDDE